MKNILTFERGNATIGIAMAGFGQWTVTGIFNGRLDKLVQKHWTNAETVDDLRGDDDRKRRGAQKHLYDCLLFEYHKHYGRVRPCTKKETPVVINGYGGNL